MRFLLIGGSGFLGRFVTSLLLRRGHGVAIFHRGMVPAPDGVEEILGDRDQLRGRADELRKFAPDAVIDFVISSGSQAEELMHVFRGSAGRVVMLSSMDVYRAVSILHGMDNGPLQPLPLTEDSELRRNLYPYPKESMQMLRATFPWLTDDYDKIPAERIVMNDRELPATVLRLPMVYGPGDHLHRFHSVVKRIDDGRRRIIFPEPLAGWKSSRGYVENVAAAIALAAMDVRASGQIYNVCEEPSFSELEWARKIAERMQWDGEFVMLPQERTPRHLMKPGNMNQHWTASSAKIRRELDFREPIEIGDAIQRTIQWERENPPQNPMFAAQFDYAAEDEALAAVDENKQANRPA
jgi:nucleoside-diphosphate-sugar epimerase